MAFFKKKKLLMICNLGRASPVQTPNIASASGKNVVSCLKILKIKPNNQKQKLSTSKNPVSPNFLLYQLKQTSQNSIIMVIWFYFMKTCREKQCKD